MLSLHLGAHMHPNCTHLVRDGVTRLLAKSRIMESELTLDPQVRWTGACHQPNTVVALETSWVFERMGYHKLSKRNLPKCPHSGPDHD